MKVPGLLGVDELSHGVRVYHRRGDGRHVLKRPSRPCRGGVAGSCDVEAWSFVG